MSDYVVDNGHFDQAMNNMLVLLDHVDFGDASWYEDAWMLLSGIAEAYEMPLGVVAGMAAVLSPHQLWSQVVTSVVTLLGDFDNLEHLGFDFVDYRGDTTWKYFQIDTQPLKSQVGGWMFDRPEGVSGYGMNVAKAIALMVGGSLEANLCGPKVTEFHRALMTAGAEGVVIDGMMVRVLTGQLGSLAGLKVSRAERDGWTMALLELAMVLKVTVAGLQAMFWAALSRLVEANEGVVDGRCLVSELV